MRPERKRHDDFNAKSDFTPFSHHDGYKSLVLGRSVKFIKIKIEGEVCVPRKKLFRGFFIDRSLVDDDQYTYVKEHCQVVQIEKKSKHRLGIIDYDEDDIKFILLFLLNLNFLKNILNEKLFAKL